VLEIAALRQTVTRDNGCQMANKDLASYAQQKFEEAKRNLGAAVNDFSIPDEKIIELRQALRLDAAEVAKASKKKKGLLGFLGL
jgi:hypothetical protein